jgi:hypothetical protein
MQFLKTTSCFISMIICIQYIYAQVVQPPVSPPNNLLFNNTQYIKTDSGLIINHYYRDDCKNYSVTTDFMPDSIDVLLMRVASIYKEPARPKLITIHGNVSYDFFYRSQIDTPFSQQNLQQHTERVWLDMLIKEKYPFKVGFTARQSNSPFFRDLFNMNLNFDKHSFNKNIKQELLNRLATIKWQNPDLKMIDSALKEKLKRYQALKNRVSGPEALQRIIEERERIFYNKQKKETVSKEDSLIIPVYHKIKLNNGQFFILKTDSLVSAIKEIISPQKDSSFTKTLQSRKDELDKLEKSIATLKHQSDSLKNSITQNISKVKQSIYKASNPKELEKIAKENGISDPQKEKLQNFLSNIKNLGIGRTMVDYTELTAQNVMLTGINIEYNPSYYAAFAAGKIDYGFRDFFGRGIKQKNQYLVLGRMGWGIKDKRAVILTLFNGRKNNYAGLQAADSNNNTARLFGYSIETIIKKNENTFFSVEVAKSTKSNNSSAQTPISKPDNLFKFSDIANMGFNIKAQTAIPETDTRLSGFFRKTGAAFQSFSLFTYNTKQQAWQVRADQSFLKRKINVTAILRQNDFTNPLTDRTFKTSTVFKSLQLNVRVPHWPTVNAGYYPGSQFYIVDNNTVRENVYYILIGSVLHAYRFKDIAMNSSFIYNRYFNQATDSGFVLYKGVNYILSQSLLIKKLQLDGSYSYNKQSELNYYTLDANGDYSLKHFLRLGGGIKYNHVQQGQSYWGESIRLSADFKKLGGLQLHYEKSYLPTIRQTLYPIEIGRVSWYKNF